MRSVTARIATAALCACVVSGTLYGILNHTLWTTIVSGGVVVLAALVVSTRRGTRAARAWWVALQLQQAQQRQLRQGGSIRQPQPPSSPVALSTCGIMVPSHPSTCCVCLEQDGEPRLLLPCLHAYHPLCIERWFRRKRTCPLCGQDPWCIVVTTMTRSSAPPALQTIPIDIPSAATVPP